MHSSSMGVHMACEIDAHVSLAALGPNLTVNFSCLPYLMSFAKAWPWVVARVYRTKASKIRPKKRASRVCCSPTAGARCQEAPLACRPHSLAPFLQPLLERDFNTSNNSNTFCFVRFSR